MNIDLASLTFVSLITIGVVNVISFFKPGIDSKIKFAVSLAVAFGLTFVPVAFGSMILEKAKEAIQVAFMASGSYKIAQKIGGK